MFLKGTYETVFFFKKKATRINFVYLLVGYLIVRSK